MLKTPPMQTATATIDNYCSRLQSATLLEDRRAAIEGLRSVAKQYPASVASGSLRELIQTLRRDGLGDTSRRRDGEPRGSEEGGDVDTIRLVLETLLRLFEPDQDSPEAGDEIALFMADEFCMKQENLSLLLNLLDPTVPYSDNLSCKLSVQIMSAICAARPERLQESILGAPLGVSRLVGVLDNQRDDVRYAGLELLTNLTGGANDELRKLVAFDDVFGRVFALIKLEGGLADARIVVQDCLTLLINLIKGSPTNQTMFRESGCISQFAELLKEAFPSEEPEAPFVVENRVRGGWGLLQLLRQLLVPGEPSTSQNQAAFFRAGLAQILVDLAFHPEIPPLVQSIALSAVADLIRHNAPLQVNFAQTQVRVMSSRKDDPNHSQTNGVNGTKSLSNRNSARQSVEDQPVYIIEALLDLMLNQERLQYALRTAACAVVQAYLAGHLEIRAHFLQRAIAGYKEQEQAPNVLSSLITNVNRDKTSVTLSGWTVQDLVAQNREAKVALAAVQEGETNEGEDVLTAIAALGSRLQQCIEQKDEEALVAAYATTLCVLLWDYADGINEFLAEGSSALQSLVDSVKSDSNIVAGLNAMLLGILYEFSTKDSPIPRKTLASILTQKLGRDKYLSALSALRSDPAVRDFDLPATESDRLELSESFFNLFLTEYPRLRRAIDKDPGIEVLPYAAAEAGVQRDILDELRNKITALEASLSQSQQEAAQSSQQAQQDKLQTEQRLLALQKDAEMEKLALQKELKAAVAESERVRAVVTKMQTSHDDEIRKAQQQHQRALEEVNVKNSREMAALRQEADRKAQQAKQQAEQGFAPVRQDFEKRLAELGNAHRAEQASHTSARTQLEALTAKQTEHERQASDLSQKLRELTSKHSELERSSQQAQARNTQLEADLQKATVAFESSEASTQQLRAQLAEVSEELKGKEQELVSERAGFAELEKELEDARAKSAAVENSNEDLQKQLETAKNAAATAAKGSNKKEAKELEDARSKNAELQKSNEDLEKQLEKAKSTAAATPAKGNNNNNNKKDSEAAKKAEKLKQLSDSLADEVKKLKADLDASKGRESAHAEELKSQQKDLDGAKEAEKSAKEELDNLLLVLADIEGKRDEYRSKVKELGGEVSDDDEEEEEDEEGERGEEEDSAADDDVD